MRGRGFLSRVILYNQGVEPAIAQRLVSLNNQFYQSMAAPFSASRGRLQPGVLKVLSGVPPEANVLDLGCGNGGVARELAQRGHSAQYVGVDFSAQLLTEAQKTVPSPTSNVQFIQVDLTSRFNQHSAISDQQFDFIFAFAVLHHIPSRAMRLAFLRQVTGLLATGGRFMHSNWQFLKSAKLRTRIQPWDTVGIDETEVEPGDYLLDWRSGGRGVRYVHHFDETELGNLAVEAGFEMVESFLSDGKSGDLALYQLWVQHILK